MANLVVTVLLTGSLGGTLRPRAYTYLRDDAIDTSGISNLAEQVDKQGGEYAFKDHYGFYNSQYEIENMIRDIYGEVPTYYPQK